MAILDIENSIINQLQSSITDLKIEGYPENPAEYKLLHPKGAVLVRFQGAKYSVPTEEEFIQQTATLNFNLALMIKGLRDRNGAYSHIDDVISALSGYSPAGCGMMYPAEVNFLTEDAGIWRYSVIFSVPVENYG